MNMLCHLNHINRIMRLGRLKSGICGQFLVSSHLQPGRSSFRVQNLNHRYLHTSHNHFASEPKFQIRFKDEDMDVKKTFKNLYSIYGPLFVVCHISISLISLGFFSALVYTTVDLTPYIPSSIIERLGDNVVNMTGGGGKFLVAYAAHKMTLPIRFGLGIWLTRYLVVKVPWLAKKKSK